METGYAIKALGPGRTIMVFNDRFGRLEELPFDLRPRLAMRYTAAEVESGVADETRVQSRRKLASALASAIKDILVRHSAETAARAAEVLREAEETRVERERRDLELARLRSENEIRLIVTQQGPAARSPAWLMTTVNIENYGEAQFVVEVPLLERARTVICPGGMLLYADHYLTPDTKLPALALARADQPRALERAGFVDVRLRYEEGHMALWCGTNPVDAGASR